MHWPAPEVAINPAPGDGPVMVTVEYRVSTEQAPNFYRAMDAMRRFRYREGAIRWDFYRDLAEPERYMETFIVSTWGEHLRQHARVTLADQTIETYAFSSMKPEATPVAAHLMDAQAFGAQTPADVPGTSMPLGTQLLIQVARERSVFISLPSD